MIENIYCLSPFKHAKQDWCMTVPRERPGSQAGWVMILTQSMISIHPLRLWVSNVTIVPGCITFKIYNIWFEIKMCKCKIMHHSRNVLIHYCIFSFDRVQWLWKRAWKKYRDWWKHCQVMQAICSVSVSTLYTVTRRHVWQRTEALYNHILRTNVCVVPVSYTHLDVYKRQE